MQVRDPAGRQLVHRIIYEEVCHGIFKSASRSRISAVIADLVSLGADAVILGCTEIELPIGQDDSPIPVLATTYLHATAALDAALDPALRSAVADRTDVSSAAGGPRAG